jgi:biopolymer transport protein ExbD
MAYGRKLDESGGVNLGIVITPMLDMSFQLLAFFIMTYHPSALEAHIDGKLLPPPKVAMSGPGDPKPKKDDATPSDEKPDDQDIVRVGVRKDYAKGDEGPKAPFDLLVELKKQGTSLTPQPILRVNYRNAVEFRDAMDPDKLKNNKKLASLNAEFQAGLKALQNELTKIRKDSAADKTTVIVDADPSLLYGYFIAIQDTCKAAKFDNVGFGAPVAAGP